MIQLYTLFTGFQITAAVVLFLYVCRFRRRCICSVWTFFSAHVMYLLWAAAIICYYAQALFMTLLWFLLGVLIGGAVSFYHRDKLPHFRYFADIGKLQCPPLKGAPLFYASWLFFFIAIQVFAFYYPLYLLSWLIQIGLGTVTGFFTGLLWGCGIASFFRASWEEISLYHELVEMEGDE
ncbi:hypothetical protein [Megasphaera vaginalis (ex Srinivasan et al. 2021)]|uniref:Uncharacterized protein n=1 Tax=Megasphaera vaginalis (ex Srinivasan et al. 2021) TaxID=1111454 RepID=U7UFR9_9FIRM|nr:hypothetical protein [Megasphaera vaginalis (ex Srinivasan et al. 2021)]ERT58195.1 hypothetical protein HMPREF1250_0825 [Megasphaera vaginalis (ex Srinivasan et al. 2021)]